MKAQLMTFIICVAQSREKIVYNLRHAIKFLGLWINSSYEQCKQIIKAGKFNKEQNNVRGKVYSFNKVKMVSE